MTMPREIRPCSRRLLGRPSDSPVAALGVPYRPLVVYGHSPIQMIVVCVKTSPRFRKRIRVDRQPSGLSVGLPMSVMPLWVEHGLDAL